MDAMALVLGVGVVTGVGKTGVGLPTVVQHLGRSVPLRFFSSAR
jgi:hypothetical protein